MRPPFVGGGHLNQNIIKNYQPETDLLKDKVIIVTGAGQGLGRAAALAYATHGATVVLHGRKVAKLEQIYDEIMTRQLPEPVIFPLDLSEATDADYENMAYAIKQQLGRLDGILNNAAIVSTLSPLANQTIEQWMQLLRVNLIAPFALTRACLPLMQHSQAASIIMTSETHGHSPAAYWGSFSVSKAGLEVLSRIWAQELEIHPNIRINTFIPGPVASPQRSATHPGEVKSSLPTPETLIPYYLYLMGQDSAGVSGEIVSAG
jgi:NAD(P)-dependent dehydrogenase (short-subunit alcohol dehydrogenase family)